jgi:hypothetical protein
MLQISRRRRSSHLRAAVESLEHRTLLATFTRSQFRCHNRQHTSQGGDRCERLAGTDTITLAAGTYDLSIANTAGQENTTLEGDLDISQSVVIQGAGAAATIIDAHQIDRVLPYQPRGKRHVQESDDQRRAGAGYGSGREQPGVSEAWGGGVLAFGGIISLQGVTFDSNEARGGDGAAGSGDGGGGDAAFGAVGGAFAGFSSGLTITIRTS